MNVKKILLYGATMLLLVSCANEDQQVDSGYGTIEVQVSADYRVEPVTRTSTSENIDTSTPTQTPDVSEFALKLVSTDGSFSRSWGQFGRLRPHRKKFP